MRTVIATAQGFYDDWRNVGDEFDIRNDVKANEEKGVRAQVHFSKKWMKLVEKSAAPEVEEIEDEFTLMDKEALIVHGLANCPDCKLPRTLGEDSMRTRLRERLA